MKWLVVCLVLLAAPAFGGENCAQMGGTCKENCAKSEVAEDGAFIDCTEKQECCVEMIHPKQANDRKKQENRDSGRGADAPGR